MTLKRCFPYMSIGRHSIFSSDLYGILLFLHNMQPVGWTKKMLYIALQKQIRKNDKERCKIRRMLATQFIYLNMPKENIM
jgi:hypothetical protein